MSEIRKKIKSDATNLASYILKTAADFKEELIELEQDNNNLKRKNKHLKSVKLEIKKKNKFLIEDLEIKNEKINKLLEEIGDEKMCYDCSHSLICGNANLCVYCQKWVCDCCIQWCRNNSVGDNCVIKICNLCFPNNDRCPLHFQGISSEAGKSLITYYKKNQFNNPFE